MRYIRPGDRISFAVGGGPGGLSSNWRRGTVLEVSKPDKLRGRNGGGIYVRVKNEMDQWVPYFRILDHRRARPEEDAVEAPDAITDF